MPANNITDHCLDLGDLNQRFSNDTEGREEYSRRMGIVEPVFANITVNKGLNYFTMRGKRKVGAQWMLYCMVHNIEKIAHYGNPLG